MIEKTMTKQQNCHSILVQSPITPMGERKIHVTIRVATLLSGCIIREFVGQRSRYDQLLCPIKVF